MGIPYRARVDERWFLDLPGSRHSGFVYTYVEDTSECGLRSWPWCGDDCDCCPDNYEPEMILELSDGRSRVRLEFAAARWTTRPGSSGSARPPSPAR